MFVTIELDPEDAAKLAELAGSDAKIDNYLTWLIQKLHQEQQGRAGLVDSDFLLREAQVLLDKSEHLKERGVTVEGRLEHLAFMQKEILARVNEITERLRRRSDNSRMYG